MREPADLGAIAGAAREAAHILASTSTASRNAALLAIAGGLDRRTAEIIAANREDVRDAQAAGMDPALVDRLLLHRERIAGMAADVRDVASLPDPVGERFDEATRPNGLRVYRQRVPLGVIGVIYESRPNVTVDVAAVCLKSGNAVVLRGGTEARRSNVTLGAIVREALTHSGLPVNAVQVLRDPDRDLVLQMLHLRGQIDLIVPRGGAGLIEFVREHARVPVVAGGIGVCHTYVHRDADVPMAVEIVDNAKTRRPSVCNALDTILVHRAVAPAFLPRLAERWAHAGVEMRCDPESLALVGAGAPNGPWRPAEPDDFGQEFLSLRAAVRVVGSLDEAVAHIERYGSGHSEAIVTDGYGASRDFVARVDAAAVYVNASTGFTDGAQLGLGAEVGISTQKFHARGPLGPRELTSYKWVVEGDGQTRP